MAISRLGGVKGIQLPTAAGGSLVPGFYGAFSGPALLGRYIQAPAAPPHGSSGAADGFAHNYESCWRRIAPELISGWRARRLSTLDFLLAVNTLASRSTNDLAQCV